MSKKVFILIIVASLLTAGGRGIAAEKNDAKAQLEELIGAIQSKLKDGQPTEKDLAKELKHFDTLVAEHHGEKTDDVAQILFMKALLYLQVLDNTEKGAEIFKQLKSDFPESGPSKRADEVIAGIEKQKESQKIQRSLMVGTKFPDFNEMDTAGKPFSIANYKGKVVLVDFWATWCGPCVSELPNVLKTYEKHHPKGFEIVGISLDEDKGKLTSFTKTQNMPWQQYFDGKKWENKLALKYGVNSIPATYLLDGEGRIVAKDLRGDALEAEVAKLLSKL